MEASVPHPLHHPLYGLVFSNPPEKSCGGKLAHLPAVRRPFWIMGGFIHTRQPSETSCLSGRTLLWVPSFCILCHLTNRSIRVWGKAAKIWFLFNLGKAAHICSCFSLGGEPRSWGQSSRTFRSPRFLAWFSASWHRVSGDWTNFKIPASPIYSTELECNMATHITFTTLQHLVTVLKAQKQEEVLHRKYLLFVFPVHQYFRTVSDTHLSEIRKN